jgi:hypothetical protein
MTIDTKVADAIFRLNANAEFVLDNPNDHDNFEVTWVNTTPISKEDIKAEMNNG